MTSFVLCEKWKEFVPEGFQCPRLCSEAAEKVMLDGEHLDLTLGLTHLGFPSLTDLNIGSFPFCCQEIHVLHHLLIHRIIAGVWDIDFCLCPFDFFSKFDPFSIIFLAMWYYFFWGFLFYFQPQTWIVYALRLVSIHIVNKDHFHLLCYIAKIPGMCLMYSPFKNPQTHPRL